jgi:hypothetical protein
MANLEEVNHDAKARIYFHFKWHEIEWKKIVW